RASDLGAVGEDFDLAVVHGDRWPTDDDAAKVVEVPVRAVTPGAPGLHEVPGAGVAGVHAEQPVVHHRNRVCRRHGQGRLQADAGLEPVGVHLRQHVTVAVERGVGTVGGVLVPVVLTGRRLAQVGDLLLVGGREAGPVPPVLAGTGGHLHLFVGYER